MKRILLFLFLLSSVAFADQYVRYPSPGAAVPVTIANGGTGATSYTVGSIPYFDGSILNQDNANLFWDSTNKRMGIGTATPAAPSDVNGSFVGAASSHITEMLTSYGDVDRFVMRAANGTSASPTTVTAALNIGSIGFRGHNGTAFASASAASFNAVPAETWTTTANGTSLNFQTTPIGSVTAAERVRFTSEGLVGIGSASPIAALEVKKAYTTAAATGGAVLVDSVVTAHANNDKLAGIYANPTFAAGGFTGTDNSAAYFSANNGHALTLNSDGNNGIIQENYSQGSETLRIGANGWILADGAGGASAAQPTYSSLQDSHSGMYILGSTVAFSTASTERVRINNNGLGIGTTSPGALLDVNGDPAGGALINIRNGASLLLTTAGSGIGDGNPRVRILTAANNAAFDLYGSGAVDSTNGYTWHAGAPTIMALTAAGSLGIGTASPGARLEIKDGHQKSTQTVAPTAAPTSNAGTGATCTAANATDMAGKITLTTTAIAGGSGDVCDVTFNLAYGMAPICMLTPISANAILDAVVQGVYLTTATGALSINFANTDVVGRVYSWSYSCIETQ